MPRDHPYIAFCQTYRSSEAWRRRGHHTLSVPEQGRLLGALYRKQGGASPKKEVRRGAVNDELLIAWQHRKELHDQTAVVKGPRGKCVVECDHFDGSYILEVKQATFRVDETLAGEDGLKVVRSKTVPASAKTSDVDVLLAALPVSLVVDTAHGEHVVFKQSTTTPTKVTQLFAFARGDSHHLPLRYGARQQNVAVPASGKVLFEVDANGGVLANGKKVFDAFR